MSAIVGIFYRNGQTVDLGMIKTINNKLSHRGPDGSNVWCDNSVALGHQMLFTTPESLNETLPFEYNGLVITADARIDNRQELLRELNLGETDNITDSYIILKSYEKWGEKCLEYLLGDFAFSIWDSNEEKLFCARDHMGVKPFYYYLDDDLFVFATEIKAIFSNSNISKHLNETKVADYLISNFEDKEITFYMGIKRLPAAYHLTISKNEVKSNEYWGFDYRKRLELGSEEEYTQAFKDIFIESVRCRLRSAFPRGSMLSGGLDSSSIACTANKILPKDQILNTFSGVFDEVPQSDERYYIDTIIKKGNFSPQYISADKISPLSNLDRVLWHLDEPLYSPNLFLHWNMYNKANKIGTRIILDGYDGDSTISHGERFLSQLAIEMKWKTFIHELMEISKNLEISASKLFFYHVVVPLIPYKLKYLFKYLNWYMKGNFQINGIKLNKSFVEKTDLFERQNSQLIFKNTIDPYEFHYYNLRSGIHQFVLEVLDKSAAAFDVEPRYPFFDKRLIEFCVSLPTEQKIFNGWDRIILRRAMQDILPQEIQWRSKKSNLGFNFERSFILYEKNNKIKQVLSHQDIVKDYVDIKKNNISNDFEKKTHTMIYGLWKVVNLALWIEDSKI